MGRSFLFVAQPRFSSRSQSAVFSLTRAVGFLFDGDGVVADPHQSPFWIKALGLPLAGNRHPAPGCLQPLKFRGALPWPSAPDLFSEAARERWTVLVHRERVATGAVRVHRSLAPARWQVQPLAGFMTEAHQHQSSAARDYRWDAATAESVLVVVGQPHGGLAAAARALSVHVNALFTSKGT